MKIALAIICGIVVVVLLVLMYFRGRVNLQARGIAEHAIRQAWVEFDITDPVRQDDIALNMLRDVCFSLETSKEYCLARGVLRTLSPDIVKNKERLEQFKKEFDAYAILRGL